LRNKPSRTHQAAAAAAAAAAVFNQSQTAEASTLL